ncbi:SpoIVB peptidase [Alteribacillus sp. HJP-4]|uniref:SpoIVB peptidase n=1 Tax=Alteribacillus sp. HJP-4 TaxID=2775394 RepID=UPI0035CD3333
MKRGNTWIGIFLLCLLTVFLTQQNVQQFLAIPDEIAIDEALTPMQKKEVLQSGLKDNAEVTAVDETYAAVKTAGFPEKSIKIHSEERRQVIPGGESIGVTLQSKGVIIVGFHEIITENGRVSPAEEAGLKAGDIILEIDGISMNSLDDVVSRLQAAKSGETLTTRIKRGNELLTKKIKAYENDEGSVIGAYIRNAATGVGTLTFVDPQTKKYGALGHVISDSDTKKPIAIKEGQIVSSSVNAIERGSNGHPGEKQAVLKSKDKLLGNVTKNSPFGIFGNWTGEEVLSKQALPISKSNEVKKGPAKMRTVVEGQEVEEFDIEVVQTIPQLYPASKGMVIKVTDPDLLNRTGGIIQGMSGSPIIQNGKIIGAVTHVFVNDSTTGYACHIEWMLNETNSSNVNNLKPAG